MSRITLQDRRILVDGRPRLLLAGEIHYFRLAPADWPDRLDRLRECGADTVATYVPWLWHELPDRSVDLHGRTDPRRDLAGFLDLAHQRGLHAIVRPGPFVMAEIKNEGIPYRVYEDAPHLLPVTWDGARVPSRTVDYLAPEFLAAAEGWYAQVMPLIAERCADRGGPVVAVQLDNEIGMLSWVTNSPDLTDHLCADLARWASERYGVTGAAERVGADPADPAAWAAALRRPAERHSLATHDLLGRYMRDRFRRYVGFLRAAAERYGVTAVPFLVNVHGTGGGRGRTFPIGISQLAEAYRGQPQLTSGSDLYLGDLTVGNVADLYVANAFLAAVHSADQPLTSLEFEAGNGDYGEDLAVRYPPEAIELKTRLCVAQGNRLLNLYLFAGGYNPPLAEPVGDGNDRLGFTGERHGFAAPIGPEGQRNPTYDAARRALAVVRGAADLLADSDEEHDGLALGFVPDHYLTEYRHPESAARAAQVADLERFRGMGPRDILARALLLGGFSFPAVDLQSADLTVNPPPALALASASTLGREVQERLVDYLRAGGRLLLHGVLPERDHDGTPCRLLADALGLRVVDRIEATAHHFPSVRGTGWAAGRAEVRVGYADLLDPAGADAPEPVLVDVRSGSPCGVELRIGAGTALVIAADYPCDLDFWRRAVGRLGVEPRLRHDADEPGLVNTSTVDRSGQRLLHLINVAPSPVTAALTYRGEPFLGGRRLRVPARGGLMLPVGLRFDGALLTGTSCELVERTGSAMVLRPTQREDVVVLDTDRPVRADRGELVVDGSRVTVTLRADADPGRPVRISIG
ncbi:beta-galactosidase [Micromonospora sp. HM5-17]|jgi:beta-galactosidase|uniref:beta-galactosidase n=1 Tax=Micromonospora sp. HM5-17 TaxID=2487710 RepID=UPI000F49F291|nr:beta-galactosidase [Micromonospora sp. HM5-17]ROT28189.1 glycosyl hydrolase [Micromonospora sp. HM5-17]